MMQCSQRWKNRQRPRQNPLFRKADWLTLCKHCDNISQKVIEMSGTCDVNYLWQVFSKGLEEGVNMFVPYKMARIKDNQPWIGSEIKTLIKGEIKFANAKMKSGSKELHNKFKAIKHEIQKQIRRSFWAYIESTPDKVTSEYV